jgi:hypothetical protein
MTIAANVARRNPLDQATTAAPTRPPGAAGQGVLEATEWCRPGIRSARLSMSMARTDGAHYSQRASTSQRPMVRAPRGVSPATKKAPDAELAHGERAAFHTGGYENDITGQASTVRTRTGCGALNGLP